MSVGYIGLGAMGSALAGRLLGAHTLSVWDTRDSASQAMGLRGAYVAQSPKDLAQRSKVVFLCLPRSADVRQVIFGPDGLVEGLERGALIIDQTSGTPAETIKIAESLHEMGIDFIDAPVSGSPPLFEKGLGTIMVSGPQAQLQKAQPLLSTVSAKVMVCGLHVGDAQAMKLVNNTINSGCRLAMLELAALGRKLGFSLEDLYGIFDSGEARSGPTQLMLPALIEGRPATNFGLALMVKDLHQATTLACQYGVPMPVAGTTLGLLQAGLSLIGSEARLDDVVKSMEMMTGSNILGSGSVDAPSVDERPRAFVAKMLNGTLAACNAVVTWESFALGLRYGLTLENMLSVIGSSSGGNGVIERMQNWVNGSPTGKPLASVLADVQQAYSIGAELVMPMLMVNAVRGLYESTNSLSSLNESDLATVRFIATHARLDFF